MSKPNVEDYLQQGIYGKKEINPDEKRKFLGTFRERVLIALTQSQVREHDIYQEVEDAIKKNKEAKLLLNGNMDYSHLSKYTKLCNQYGLDYTMVTNKEYDTDLGLVLAYEYAIDKEEIFVTQKKVKFEEKNEQDKKGVFSIFKKVFGN